MMRWLRVPAVLITASLALGIGLIELKRSVDGRRKIAVAGLMADAPRHDLSIRLSVPPEQFHMHRLQRWGVMVGAQGQVVRLRNVPAQELPTIARQPWVAALSPLAGS
jgi:hypothetical protein